VLQPAAEAAGLGRVTWHQFRHIHSSPLSIYTHGVDSSHRKAVEEVEERLFSESHVKGRKSKIRRSRQPTVVIEVGIGGAARI
jgi:hypothetical protein